MEEEKKKIFIQTLFYNKKIDIKKDLLQCKNCDGETENCDEICNHFEIFCQTALKRKQFEFKELEKALEEKNKKIKEQEKQIEEKNKQIKEQEKLIEEQEKQIKHLKIIKEEYENKQDPHNQISDSDLYYKNRVSSNSIYETEKVKQRPHCGLRNLGNTCYMNSIIQTLLHSDIILEILNKNKDCLFNFDPILFYFLKIHDNCYDKYEMNKMMEKFLFYFTKSYPEFANKSYGHDPKNFYMKFMNSLLYFLQMSENTEPLKKLIFTEITKLYGNCSCYKSNNVKIREAKEKSFLLMNSDNHNKLTDIIDNYNQCQIECHCQRGKVTVQKKIKEFPYILVIVVEKFVDKHNQAKKPLIIEEEITLKDAKDSSKTYKLYSIIDHLGSSIHTGHAISYVKSSDNWHVYNDTMVQSLNEKEESNLLMKNENGYMFFYKLE